MRIREAVIAAAMLGLVACGKSGGSTSSSSGSTGTTATSATTGTPTSTSGTSGTHSSSSSSGTVGSNSSGTSSGTVGSNSSGTSSSGTAGGSTGSTGTTATNGGSTGSTGTTGGPPPANDLCSGAIALTAHAVGDTQSVTGDTTNANSEGSASCGGSGPDVYYTLTTTAAAHVTIHVTPSTSDLEPVIDLLNTCGFTTADGGDTEIKCNDSGAAGTAGTLDIHNLPAGTYTIAVDGYSGSAGPFAMDVTLAAPILPPANETCATAEALTVHAAGDTQTVTSFTTDSVSDFASMSCGGQASPDVFYSLHLTAAARVVAQVTATGSGYAPFLSLATSCTGADGGAAEVGCTADPGGTSATLDTILQAGDYLLVVDGFDSQDIFGGLTPSSGDFSLTVTASAPGAAPANDACAGATALTVANVGDTQTVSGDTTSASSDYSSAVCQGAGPDVFYTFTLATDARVTATLSQPDGGSLFGVLSLVDGCPGSAELSCAVGGGFGQDTVLDELNVPAGTHYLVADNLALRGGPFDLSVALAAAVPVPANDLCANALPLTAVDGGFTASGTNFGAKGEYVSGCGGSGPDIYYSLTLAQAAHITATVVPAASADGGGLTPVVTIRSGCAAPDAGNAGELNCSAAGAAGDPATAESLNAQPGDYVIVVDGYSGSYGDFNLQVTLDAPVPPPANDTCATAATLTVGTPVTGTTVNATNNYTSAGTNTCTTYAVNGPDVVYNFTAPSTGSYTFTLTPTDATSSGPDVALYVNDTCPAPDFTTCTGGADEGLAGDPETVTVNLTGGTTYVVVVDAYGSTDQGDFTLSVTSP